jgi:hypothetical protein
MVRESTFTILNGIRKQKEMKIDTLVGIKSISPKPSGLEPLMYQGSTAWVFLGLFLVTFLNLGMT